VTLTELLSAPTDKEEVSEVPRQICAQGERKHVCSGLKVDKILILRLQGDNELRETLYACARNARMIVCGRLGIFYLFDHGPSSLPSTGIHIHPGLMGSQNACD
jgi:hypothetical protein